jgi:predicted MFS family arabinose efflux permease
MDSSSEFRRNWRPLLASFIGVGSAFSLNSYVLSTFAPYLIAEFHWTRAQWALLGVVQILVLVCLPIAGRLADLYSVRKVAAAGAIAFPLSLVAITLMNGDIRIYLVIYVVQTIVCVTTTTTVYSRLVAGAFTTKRGLALAISGVSTPLVAAIGSPLVTYLADEHGWRAGYLAIAAFSATCAILTMLLIPRREPTDRTGLVPVATRSSGVYATLARMPAFWIILGATFLANLPFSLATSQLKMVALEQGLSDATAAMLISTFALGSIAGRIISGMALDYLSAHVIAATNFAMPAAGLLLLATGQDAPLAVGGAILLIGLAFGGEADIIPYLVARYFGIEIYSTVLGLLSAAMGVAMALGNGMLGIVLHQTHSFDLYFLIAATAALAGSAMFLLLGGPRLAVSPAGLHHGPATIR